MPGLPLPSSLPSSHVFQDFLLKCRGFEPLKGPRLVSCQFYFSFQNARKGKKMEKCYEGGNILITDP